MTRTRPFRIGCFAVLALVLVAPALEAAAQVKVYGGIDPESITAGGRAELRIVVEGPGSGDAKFEIPGVRGIRIERPKDVLPEISISTTMVGGRVTQRRTATFRFNVVGIKPGDHVIPPFDVEVPGQPTARTPRLTLNVQPNPEGDDPLVFLEVRPRKRTVYVGEPIEVRVQVGLLLPYAQNEIPDGKRIFLPSPTPSRGLDPIEDHSNDGPATRPTLQVPTADGDPIKLVQTERRKDYEVYETTLMWIPRKSGTWTFSESSYTAQIATRVERVRGFFDDRLVAREVQAAIDSAPSFRIKARPLPRQGRPPDYSGFIGQLEQEVTVDRHQVAVGESLKLTREIRGSGNIDLVEPPAIVLPDSFKTFGVLIQREPGAIKQILDIAPRSPEANVVPEISVSFFDTDRGVYVTQTSNPIALQVAGGTGEALSLLPGAVTVTADLRGLKRTPGRKLRVPGLSSAALVVFPLLFGLAGLLAGRVRRTRLSDEAGLRRRNAPRLLRQRLGRLEGEESADARELAHGVRRALAEYLSDLTGEPVGRFLHDLTEPLGDRLEEQTLSRVLALAEACDRITFGGGGRADSLTSRLRSLTTPLRRELETRS